MYRHFFNTCNVVQLKMTELTRITYYSVQIKYLEVELANESKTRDLQWHRHQKKKLMSSDHMSSSSP